MGPEGHGLSGSRAPGITPLALSSFPHVRNRTRAAEDGGAHGERPPGAHRLGARPSLRGLGLDPLSDPTAQLGAQFENV